MKHTIFNVGTLDLSIRLALASLLLLLVLLGGLHGLWLSTFALLIIPTVFFAIFRWDPLYAFFNFSTYRYR